MMSSLPKNFKHVIGSFMEHLALIMDGNRRWATRNNFATVMGHHKGAEATRVAMQFCLKNAIKNLSLYAFSLENMRRSAYEQSYLMNLIAEVGLERIAEALTHGVRIRFIGDRSLFPDSVQKAVRVIEEQTAAGTNLTLNILFYYGAQQELLSAFKNLATQVQEGTLAVHHISDQTLRASMWTAGIPDPELVIRTGGHARLSNFLLYQAAYSEIMFLDCLWPDLTEAHLATCLNQFNAIQRNFGG